MEKETTFENHIVYLECHLEDLSFNEKCNIFFDHFKDDIESKSLDNIEIGFIEKDSDSIYFKTKYICRNAFNRKFNKQTKIYDNN